MKMSGRYQEGYVAGHKKGLEDCANEIERLQKQNDMIFNDAAALTQAIDALAIENERLRAGWKREADKDCKWALQKIEQLEALVKALADDLAADLAIHYAPVMDYPSERRKYERDMANVYEARRVLEEKAGK